MKQILTASLVALVFTITVSIIKSNNYTKGQKYILGILFFFPPLQWVLAIILKLYNNQENKKIEKHKKSKETEKIKKAKNKFDLNNNRLLELKKRKIITKKEYKEKIKINNRKKRTNLVENSKEYKSLKSLKEEGILTNEEFELKLKLIENIYSEKKHKKKKKGNKSKEEKNNILGKGINETKSVNKFKTNINLINIPKEIYNTLQMNTLNLMYILNNPEEHRRFYNSYNFMFYIALELDNRNEEISENNLLKIAKKYYNTEDLDEIIKNLN